MGVFNKLVNDEVKEIEDGGCVTIFDVTYARRGAGKFQPASEGSTIGR